MSKTVHAIYENGVFKPTEALDLPDQCQVEFEFRIVDETKGEDRALDDVYAVLSESFEGGQFDDAARHNEHLP
jgi:predicted DNA-binding antitoxin AbrB/MazE fold protein